MFVIVAKTIIALICAGLVVLLLVFQKQVETWLSRRSSQKIVGVWVLTRLLPFVVTFLLLDYTPFSDIDGFYGQALGAVALKMVYRDFYCMYSPLFPYLNAAALWLWMSKKAIVLLMILMEGSALWLSLRFYRPLLSVGRRAFLSLLYLLMPGSLILCVFGGQEDVWLWLTVIGAYLLAQKTGRWEWLGVGVVVGFMLTKAVFVLMGPVLLLLVPKPQRWLWPMALMGALCFGVLYHLTEWAWLDQPMNEAATLRAPNLISVLNPLTFDALHAGAKFWNWIGLLLTTGAGTWVAFRTKHVDFRPSFSAAFVVLYATMMLVQQSAYSNYIFIFLIPLVFVWIDFNNRQEVTWLLIFNVVSVVHPSLWWRLERPYYHSPSDIFAQPIYGLDYALQVGIVICTAYFIRLVWQKAVR
ncbi:MAG: hypothetical protein MUE30_01135 [Spirosomaceae bacterium]|nr:hypothetical protein [Spirosomataceae bacterium]